MDKHQIELNINDSCQSEGVDMRKVFIVPLCILSLSLSVQAAEPGITGRGTRV